MTQTDAASIDREIAAYKGMAATLLRHHSGKFVHIKNGVLQEVSDTFDRAATVAVQRFGRQLGLIRQVGAPCSQLSGKFHPALH